GREIQLGGDRGKGGRFAHGTSERRPEATRTASRPPLPYPKWSAFSNSPGARPHDGRKLWQERVLSASCQTPCPRTGVLKALRGVLSKPKPATNMTSPLPSTSSVRKTGGFFLHVLPAILYVLAVFYAGSVGTPPMPQTEQVPA